MLNMFEAIEKPGNFYGSRSIQPTCYMSLEWSFAEVTIPDGPYFGPMLFFDFIQIDKYMC